MMENTAVDFKQYMKRAVELAEMGRGTTSPNPMVGALILKDGRVIAEGYHQKAGEPHAEINAFNNATEDVEGATMVVSLEPCNHHGRTPPCSEAIINAGIKKVIVGMIDPNPKCAGGGIKRLRDAGIEIEYGVLSDVVAKQNEVFIKYITTGRPFVVLKAAVSLDGKIAQSPERATAITGEAARKRAHELRNQYDAIMVGIGTVTVDNPQLTTRLERENTRNPVRIIVDSKARIPLSSKIVSTAHDVRTIIATTSFASLANIEDLKVRGLEIIKLETWDGTVDVELLLEELGSREISSILVEGGGKLAASFVKAGLVDKYMIFIAPKFIGKQGVDLIGGRLDVMKELRIESIEQLGKGKAEDTVKDIKDGIEDILVEAYPKKKGSLDVILSNSEESRAQEAFLESEGFKLQ
ncbi:MAG: riboflavin biosynthesis protein RibD [Candidatus Aquicultor secundus]|nr:bifunctional diaminohydroxyphosphoribosylaminopyrimidine deaminase/5-amino-6-(5-phosphoribosylamino)uracil reductase RibD [Candidatus Aquicultor secundus]OIO87527.1 MAG: riboflavin biosynthesis protein RibD [Candidatus Aquicultor secundus]